jgi:hypothetical protein
MKNSAFDNFNESAQEALNFARCQRPDGSFYGTSGQCRQGTPAGAKEKEASRGKMSTADAKKLSKDLTRQIGEADKKGDSAAVKTLMKAKGDVDATIKARGGEGGGSSAADKAADKAAKGLAKMRSQDQKLAAAQARVKEQLKTASPARAKSLRAKRADLEEARTKLKYQMKGLGGGQSRLTGADVKRAVGTSD